ncbi:hypothetical protein [Tenacibaculum sp. nBUS_03]|uniref:hypothetical protein n=1 Tax=Tenacibaculum sp. nBUS_03 TaxID=3395320 RepID=UPI003EB924D3
MNFKPFITNGPNFLNIGLLLLALNYLKQNKLGMKLLVITTLIAFFGRFTRSRLIYVYAITTTRYTMIFYKNKSIDEYQTQ